MLKVLCLCFARIGRNHRFHEWTNSTKVARRIQIRGICSFVLFVISKPEPRELTMQRKLGRKLGKLYSYLFDEVGR